MLDEVNCTLTQQRNFYSFFHPESEGTGREEVSLSFCILTFF